jgi:hypothetical protein
MLIDDPNDLVEVGETFPMELLERPFSFSWARSGDMNQAHDRRFPDRRCRGPHIFPYPKRGFRSDSLLS